MEFSLLFPFAKQLFLRWDVVSWFPELSMSCTFVQNSIISLNGPLLAVKVGIQVSTQAFSESGKSLSVKNEARTATTKSCTIKLLPLLPPGTDLGYLSLHLPGSALHGLGLTAWQDPFPTKAGQDCFDF